MEGTVYNALPKLPGYSFALSQPPTYAKSHGLDFFQGVPVVKSVVSLPVTTSQGPSSATAGGAFSEAAIRAKFPSWGSLDGKVLRFFGYFVERVSESAIEESRVRRVTAQLYLSDGTLNLVETLVHPGKSGMRGGCLMSRAQFPGVNAATLTVGTVIVLRQTAVTIVDCDSFTRSFYAAFGIHVPEAMSFPSDTFDVTVTAQNARAKRPDEDYANLKVANEMAAAAANGHPVSVMNAESRQKAQTYLTNDEILKFYAVHNRRDFSVLFFLCDGSVAVTETHAPNDGRDQLASFVRRGPVPKGNYVLKALDSIARPRGAVDELVGPQDLVTGQPVIIYGREYFLYDADDFTKRYYATRFDTEVAAFPKPPSEMDGRPQPQRPTDLPPYTGYGSEEDSLSSWKRLVGKPPKKDTAKFIKHVSDVLRFSAEIANPLPEDSGRAFIVCFFLADDTVSVFEYAVRNTGHTGGKAFARASVKGISAESMIPGAELKLGGQVYRLTSMDERTDTFLSTGVSMGAVSSDSKAEDVLLRLKQCLTQRFSRVTDAYRHFNPSKTGIGIADLKRMFSECEVKVESDQLLADCMRVVDVDRDGVISLQEFVEHLLKQTLVVAQPTAPASANRSAPAHMTAINFHESQLEKQRRDFADAALKKFIAKLDARRAFIVDTFRIVSDRSVDGLIDVQTFRRAITDRLALQMSEVELDALVYKFFYVPNMPEYLDRRLSLRDFRKVLDRCV